MQKNGFRVLGLSTRSRETRKRGRARDTIEKENIRKRTLKNGREDQCVKDLIYNTNKGSDMYIPESSRFNRNISEQIRVEENKRRDYDKMRRQRRVDWEMQQRETAWVRHNQEVEKEKRKNQIKKKRVYQNPFVKNLGFDLLNLEYKKTNHGMMLCILVY